MYTFGWRVQSTASSAAGGIRADCHSTHRESTESAVAPVLSYSAVVAAGCVQVVCLALLINLIEQGPAGCTAELLAANPSR